jgi:membrane-bound serine protease (ClpP class)
MQSEMLKSLKHFLHVGLIFCILIFAFCIIPKADAAPQVYVLKFSGPIGPVSADYIISGIEQAEASNAKAVLLKLDTPGGLDESMREIIQKILNSKVPIITYVSPSGARAASAGVFITLASDFAVMAPGTNIGAAHPISIGEKQTTPEMQEKITNDAATYIISLAEKRNRNKEWAEQAVRKSVSASANEALQLNIIDFIATDDADLFAKLDSVLSLGTKEIGGKSALYRNIDSTRFSTARTKDIPLTARQRFLLFLTNPNVAYILLMLGIYGLFFELQSPGAIFPGVVGAISIILAFYSLHMLPTNYAALALIGAGIFCFILEVKVTSHGILTLGGITALILGSLFLFQSSSPYYRLATSVIIFTAIFTALFFIWVIGMAIRAHRKKVTTGKEGLLLETGIAQTDLDSEGMIMIHGELWSVESTEGKINKGEKVQVISIEGMKLRVKRIPK